MHCLSLTGYSSLLVITGKSEYPLERVGMVLISYKYFWPDTLFYVHWSQLRSTSEFISAFHCWKEQASIILYHSLLKSKIIVISLGPDTCLYVYGSLVGHRWLDCMRWSSVESASGSVSMQLPLLSCMHTHTRTIPIVRNELQLLVTAVSDTVYKKVK